jgi:membrane-bound inhibitor of C-type lysozyme
MSLSHRLLCAAAVAAPLAACQPPPAPEDTPAPPVAETAAVTPAPVAPPVAATPAGPITYTCPDGKTVVATYTGETASVVYDGKTYAMTQVISASGVRYQGDGLQWWSRGMSEGMVAPLAAGASQPAEGTTVTCTAPVAPAPTG